MDISLNDLKVALERAQENGFETPNDLAAFAWGYLQAGPLKEFADQAAEAVNADARLGMKAEYMVDLNGLPEGTRVSDIDGDVHEKQNGVWQLVRWNGWDTDRHPSNVSREYDEHLEDCLPGTVVKVGD